AARLEKHPEEEPHLRCGYIQLPEAAQETRFELWEDFDPTICASALLCASQVLQAIDGGRFWPPLEKPLWNKEPWDFWLPQRTRPTDARTPSLERSTPMNTLPDNFQTHSLITASAGSGKTWRLSNRILQLILQGEPPESIVALTFTRKAAGEFFETVLGRLARAAADLEAARELCRALQMAERKPEDFLPPLRALASSLHRLQLTTIDSFFYRIAAAFPLELGLGGHFSLLDNHSADQARQEALSQVLYSGSSGARDRQAFLESFRQATWGRESKQLGRSLKNYLENYYELFRESGDAADWTRQAYPEWLQPHHIGEDPEQLISRIDEKLLTLDLKPKQLETWEKSKHALAHWLPHLKLESPASRVWDNLLGAWTTESPELNSFNLGGSKIHPDAELSQLFRALILHWRNLSLSHALRQTKGIASILQAYDQAYERRIRSQGRLVFADLPLLLDPNQTASPEREHLEFRLDSKFKHWLLDEFQDTSRAQWRVLANLIDEVLQDNSRTRSFFCVGDVKQSLYGWRGGDHRLFDELRARYAPVLSTESLTETHRCSLSVVDWVNQTLGQTDLIQQILPLGGPEWARHWAPHRSARKTKGLACYLELPSEKTKKQEAEDEEQEETDLQALLQLLQKIQPLTRGLSCAVLVYSNKKARQIAEYLRREGKLPVVLEGTVEPGRDNLYGLAIIAWAQALAHPTDTLSEGWLRASPLKSWLEMLGQDWRLHCWDRLAGEGFLFAVETILTHLQEAHSPDLFHEQRARILRQATRKFDQSGSRDPDVFVQFLKSYQLRSAETPGAIQVMTIHKSKGLGFDLVILMELVRRQHHINQRRNAPLCGRNAEGRLDWICEMPNQALLRTLPEAEAFLNNDEALNAYENLCLLYVAMTGPGTPSTSSVMIVI
ncbi:MAG: UvrD-helicase domain-containing protein, partial [Blastochloris sp.]|nr:UvrD-helicase domain-containing protein [Blastochloris sp.]